MAPLPDGTVTFLFTDIEGSTRLWERHPDAMQGALARHDAILRGAVERHGGYVVKTTGDGVHAAFPTAAAAATAAVDAQRGLGDQDWGEVADLSVRTGLHTGTAQIRDGDYYGTALNRAARLMSVAHGGQILCSDATAHLLRDEPAFGLVDLGVHHLRGLDRPERIAQVVAPGLRAEFPPLVTLSRPPGNLPARATSFVARHVEMAEIADALRGARLVTLTGTGGVGKTRLAIEVAAEAAGYRDGAWVCELAAADDDDALAQVVANTLGVTPRPGLSPTAGIAEFLRLKHLLLVLDNCEHLVDAASLLAASILREAPDVRILATSREALGLPAERVVRVRSLAVPDVPDPDLIWPGDAIRLFVDRAEAAGARLERTAANALAIAEICRRLDGIPLAIELAAARAAAMVPADIASHLDERFRLLSGRRRGALERHQTLRAAVDWSYSLLPPPERLVFDRLGVFPGTFDTAAAIAVASGVDLESWDVVDALSALVTKSMLLVDEHSETATRYRALETLRQYARERLDDAGDGDHRRRLHAAHYADVAESIADAIHGPDELRGRRRLDAELDNLRSAVGWSLDRDDADRALAFRIVGALSLAANSGFPDVGTWALRALPFVAETTPGRRSAVLAAAGWNAANTGDFAAAEMLATEALRGGIDAEWRSPALVYVLLGLVRLYAGDTIGAIAALDDGERALGTLADDRPLDRLMLATARPAFLALAGDPADAAARDALRLARAVGAPTPIATAALTVAVPIWRTELTAAAALLDESITLVRAGAFPVVLGFALAIRAQLRARAGDRIRALDDLRDAVAFSHDKGDLPMLAVVFDRATQGLTELDEHELAAVTAGIAFDGPLAPMANLPVAELPFRAEAVERSRSALGTAAYDSSRRRGAQLVVDDAVRFTLAALDQLRAS